MKLKKILQESNAPGFKDRKFGAPLPTLASVQAAYEAKQLAEQEDEEGIDEAKSLKQYSDEQLIALHKQETGEALLQAIEKELKKRKVKLEAAPKMKKSKETENIKKIWMATSGLTKGGGSGRYGKEFDKAKKKAMQALHDMMTYSKIGV